MHDEIPNEWSGMRALQEVYITNTGACKSLPAWTNPSLRTIDFSRNNLQGSLSTTWSQMPALTSVDISGNNFCGCVPGTWTSSVLQNAAEAAGGSLLSSTCATSNACTIAKLRCTAAPVSPTTTPTSAPTFDATLAFLQRFPDELRALKNSWTGTDYCSWEGISCDANGYVSIDLSGRDLTGHMPSMEDHIDGSQVMVTSIDMSNNAKITDNFRNDWARLSNLRSLDLSHTALRGAIPDAWNGMRSLQSIKVSHTNACKGLPNWNISTLQTADLSNNKMGGTLSSAWAGMGSLASVDITGNSFCGCVPSSWSSSTVLASAAAAIGGNLVSSSCSTSNACGKNSYKCPNAAAGPLQLTVAVVATFVAAAAMMSF
ncbi:Surface antigen-like protein [Lotmaria passim]